eukprot:6190214-Pleurochrysis_carterae.AAC.3
MHAAVRRRCRAADERSAQPSGTPPTVPCRLKHAVRRNHLLDRLPICEPRRRRGKTHQTDNGAMLLLPLLLLLAIQRSEAARVVTQMQAHALRLKSVFKASPSRRDDLDCHGPRSAVPCSAPRASLHMTAPMQPKDVDLDNLLDVAQHAHMLSAQVTKRMLREASLHGYVNLQYPLVFLLFRVGSFSLMWPGDLVLSSRA